LRKEVIAMKKKWIAFRIIVSICSVLGWWGLLYPELVLTPDTVIISAENEAESSAAVTPAKGFGKSLYLDLLNAGEDNITFRSRLLTDLSILWENIHDRNGNK